MICPSSPPSIGIAPTRPDPAMLVGAARTWRQARGGGRATQPSLVQALAPYGCPILAPVLDSLLLFYESALGRSMVVGDGGVLSDDEALLLGLVDGSRPRTCIRCPQGRADALDCAVCSTRIMMALALSAPATGTLQ